MTKRILAALLFATILHAQRWTDLERADLYRQSRERERLQREIDIRRASIFEWNQYVRAISSADRALHAYAEYLMKTQGTVSAHEPFELRELRKAIDRLQKALR